MVRQKYNRLASIYDRRWQNYIDNSLSFLIDFAEISAEARILDLACGTGELARLILNNNPQQQITGVDLSESMLAIAQNKLKNSVNLRRATATALPFKDNSFDLIICANAFHYFPSPHLALIEMKRVLKPEGKIIILDWCRDYWVLKIGDRLFRWLDSAYQHCYTQAELERALQISGCTAVKSRKIRFGVIWELLAVIAVET